MTDVPTRAELLNALDVAAGVTVSHPGPALLEKLRQSSAETRDTAVQAATRSLTPGPTGPQGPTGATAVSVAAVTGKTATTMTVRPRNTGLTAATVPAGALTAVAVRAPDQTTT